VAWQTKYGVKLYLLCEKSGYAWNMLAYCGKMDTIAGLGHTESVVLKLGNKCNKQQMVKIDVKSRLQS